MFRQLKCTFFLVLPFLISCKTLTSTVMFETEKNFEYTQFAPQKRSDACIKPYDQLSILMATNGGQVLLENLLSYGNNQTSSNTARYDDGLTYMIEKDSIVKIPTLGEVKLAGLTIRQAESVLEQKFSKNYQNPFVKIRIKNRRVIFFFEEGTQGKIVELPQENLTLIEALAKAGGLSPNSKSHKIKLLRGDPQNPQIFQYNIRSLNDLRKTDLVLESNDVVYVEARPRYISKFVGQLQPYLMLLSSSILVYTLFIRK